MKFILGTSPCSMLIYYKLNNLNVIFVLALKNCINSGKVAYENCCT